MFIDWAITRPSVFNHLNSSVLYPPKWEPSQKITSRRLWVQMVNITGDNCTTGNWILGNLNLFLRERNCNYSSKQHYSTLHLWKRFDIKQNQLSCVIHISILAFLGWFLFMNWKGVTADIHIRIHQFWLKLFGARFWHFSKICVWGLQSVVQFYHSPGPP